MNIKNSADAGNWKENRTSRKYSAGYATGQEEQSTPTFHAKDPSRLVEGVSSGHHFGILQ